MKRIEFVTASLSAATGVVERVAMDGHAPTLERRVAGDYVVHAPLTARAAFPASAVEAESETPGERILNSMVAAIDRRLPASEMVLLANAARALLGLETPTPAAEVPPAELHRRVAP